MKTDVVLTMDEYLNMCCGVPKPVNPPADNARHIPITSEVDARSEEPGCRCDRWGHPCPGRLEPEVQMRTTSYDLVSKQVR